MQYKAEGTISRYIAQFNEFVMGLEGHEKEKNVWEVLSAYLQYMRAKYEHDEEESEIFEDANYDIVPKGSKIKAPEEYQDPARPTQWYRKGSTEDPRVNEALMDKK
jgi:hypothetical protein